MIDCKGDGSGPFLTNRVGHRESMSERPSAFQATATSSTTRRGWVLWDTGIDDAVTQLPNHRKRCFREWGPGTGPIWRKPITLAAQLEEIHVTPSDIKLMAVSHSHPDHAGNIEMLPNTLMLVQKVEYEWAGQNGEPARYCRF